MSPARDTDRPSRFPWPPVLLAACIGLSLALGLIVRLPVPLAETGPGEFFGMTLLLAGVGLIVWASLQFRAHRTSIRPDRGAEALLTVGPFAFSRNPIYLGEVLALVGAGIAYNYLWLVVVAPLFAYAVTRLAIVREESYLERRFGAPYADYKARVRRWL